VLENELQYHGLAVRINNGDDEATSSTNLVNLCLVTPEMTGLLRTYVLGENRFITCIRRSAINTMEYCYADGHINSSNDQGTSDINLVCF